MMDRFWQGKKVLITGHTGFKGSWLCLWLQHLGADVAGYALAPPTDPSLFELADVGRNMVSVIGDIRDEKLLRKVVLEAAPEIVIHMAAQPLVRESYKNPVETYSTNVMGTVNLFEAVRRSKGVKAILNITTDKCYENREWLWGYRENEPMGGYDPYSASKSCSELITASYRNSFFSPAKHKEHSTRIASARVGNVIGGGDWAKERLIPDCVSSLLNGKKIVIRSPFSVRPWQHVLEPLNGYLMLAEKLYGNGFEYAQGWNFGPDDSDAKTVEWIVKRMCAKWGHNAGYDIDNADHPHEAHYLKLDCSKAKLELGWRPKWNLDYALDKVIEWTKAYRSNENLKEICLQQIREYYASRDEV